MKNSAWYHKIWLKKLSELPLKEDSDSAWAGMKELLDTQLPVNSPGSGSNGTGGNGGHVPAAAKSFVAKLAAMTGYVLPAAAAIGLTTYAVLSITSKPAEHPKKQQIHLTADSLNHKLSSVIPDSLKDTTALKANSLNDTVLHAVGMTSAALVTENFKAPQTGNVIATDKNKQDTTDGSNGVNRHAALSQAAGGTFNHVANSKVTSESSAKSDNTVNTSDGVKEVTPPVIPFVNTKPVGVKDFYEKKEDVLSLAGKNIEALNSAQSANISNPEKTTVAKTALSKNNKDKQSHKNKAKQTKETFANSPYNLGIEAGWNASQNSSLYLGITGSYSLSSRLLLNAGVRLSTPAKVSGSYNTKPSVVYLDSLSLYKVSDNMKIMMLNVPLTVEYKISDRISVNAGPVISFPVSQSANHRESQFIKGSGPSSAYLTALRQHAVDSTLTETTHNKLDKINLGITGGVNIRFGKFYIDAKYLRGFTPYRAVNSELGGYQQNYQSLQLGIGYKLKK